PSAGGEPDNRILQQVQLEAGTYVLSWWDQARDGNGDIAWAGASPPSYIAAILDPSWKTVKMFDQPPFTPAQVGNPGGAAMWSPRRTLSFTVTNAGTYAVAFSASSPVGALGSVAIANVQLEQAADATPTTYVATGTSTMVDGIDCPMTDAAFRSALTRSCDPNGRCHYDLTVPFIVDTSALDGSSLNEKLANGNYNYRQRTTALNLVGTSL